MHSISYRDITITGGFWQAMQRRNHEVTMPAVLARFEETGRMAAFRCEKTWPEGQKPHFFWDSDVAKWLEAAAYILQKQFDPVLEQAVEDIVALIEKNQGADGYFNIYFTVVEPEMRWQNRDWHELYCAGHLLEAAVAYYEATGRDQFLNCMRKYADYIERVFMIEQSANFVTPGHEEIELALVRLWRCTGEARYLQLSKFFINQRGNNNKDKSIGGEPRYAQNHLPVREQTTAEGHAVRATYLYCAMADLAMELNDEGLLNACRALFENITQKRMYVTGGVGSTHRGEAFTIDYDLPNETAYAETCAAIGLSLFCRRMSTIEPEGRYADAAERAIYNGFLSGISEDGTAFFYENPLEIHPALRHKDTARPDSRERFPITRRQKVFSCSCCPPNAARFIASFGDFLFSRNESTLYVHHYACASVGNIEMTTEYPADGSVSLRLRGMAGKRVALRIPGWCGDFTCSAPVEMDRGYCYVNIPNEDFALKLNLKMLPRLVHAHPRVYNNAGRAAVMRGPIVYCMEGLDNGENLRALSIAPGTEFTGGFDLLACDGYRLEESAALYSSAPPECVPQRLRFIPYYRFANRSESEMAVWVRCESTASQE